jgi:hypothetical protein
MNERTMVIEKNSTIGRDNPPGNLNPDSGPTHRRKMSLHPHRLLPIPATGRTNQRTDHRMRTPHRSGLRTRMRLLVLRNHPIGQLNRPRRIGHQSDPRIRMRLLVLRSRLTGHLNRLRRIGPLSLRFIPMRYRPRRHGPPLNREAMPSRIGDTSRNKNSCAPSRRRNGGASSKSGSRNTRRFRSSRRTRRENSKWKSSISSGRNSCSRSTSKNRKRWIRSSSRSARKSLSLRTTSTTRNQDPKRQTKI